VNLKNQLFRFLEFQTMESPSFPSLSFLKNKHILKENIELISKCHLGPTKDHIIQHHPLLQYVSSYSI